MNKLLIVCGPTATGKTSLSITLAKKFNGEIISADSRQVYKGMDITTGKDKPKDKTIKIHGYDLVKPIEDFSVAHFVLFAQNKIKQIYKKNKLPIIAGGTGLYIKSLLKIPKSLTVPPNPKLRTQLENLSLGSLQVKLKKLNPSRLKKMNRSDRLNPRRLIRAIEIASSPKICLKESSLQLDPLWIGLKAPLKFLDDRINQRILRRIDQGMTQEVKRVKRILKDKKLPAHTSLGFDLWCDFLDGKITRTEAINRWQTSERQYARNQLTYFKPIKSINWFDVSCINYQKQVVSKVKTWYS